MEQPIPPFIEEEVPNIETTKEVCAKAQAEGVSYSGLSLRQTKKQVELQDIKKKFNEDRIKLVDYVTEKVAKVNSINAYTRHMLMWLIMVYEDEKTVFQRIIRGETFSLEDLREILVDVRETGGNEPGTLSHELTDVFLNYAKRSEGEYKSPPNTHELEFFRGFIINKLMVKMSNAKEVATTSAGRKRYNKRSKRRNKSGPRFTKKYKKR